MLTSTPHFRAASACVSCCEVTSRNTSHFSSGDSCRRLRGLPFSIITSSWSGARTASQDWREKQGQLYRKLRRKPRAWSGWHSLDNDLSDVYKAPSAVSKRLAPILAAGLYDTAIREMSVHLEVEMCRGLGGSDLYGQQLVEKLIHDLEPVMLEADLKVLRGNLRALFEFVRNEFAHNVIDISRPRAISILQELGEVYEAIVALGTITNTPDPSSE